jgi:predicted kinase
MHYIHYDFPAAVPHDSCNSVHDGPPVKFMLKLLNFGEFLFAMIKTVKLCLYIMLGYPGSGKSYVARQLSQASGATRLSQDRFRAELFENPREHMSAADDKRLLTFMNEKVVELLKAGTSVIYDANVTTYKDRTKIYEIASTFTADSYLVWVKTPIDVSIERNGPEQIDEAFRRAYVQMVTEYEKSFEQPKTNEQTILIDGQSSIEDQLDRIPR